MEETEVGNFGNGTSNNTFSYSDTAGNTYNREVNAALDVITFNQESGSLAPETPPSFPPPPHFSAPAGGKARTPGTNFRLPGPNGSI